VSNIYYQPAEFGLTTVGEVDYVPGCYEFDLLVVWQDANGRYFYGEDSGCSCPAPFESQGLSDLVQTTGQGVIDRIRERLGKRRDWDTYAETDSQANALMSRIVR
jgi:hypothetical protein